MKYRVISFPISLACLLSALSCGVVSATETENQGLRILPAPGKVTVDADVKDWDLSGGIFVCSDAENLRGRIATWFHAMWDSENLYLLARWVDDTPLNNPGRVSGDQGFEGDCLQVRTICFAEVARLRRSGTGHPAPRPISLPGAIATGPT